MNSIRYPPSTPKRGRRRSRRSQRGSGGRNTSPGPRRGRGTPRTNRFCRPSRRSYGDGYSNPAPRYTDSPHTPFGERRGSYWRSCAGEDTTGSPWPYSERPKSPAYSPEAELSEDGLLTDPHKKIPVVVSPNTRERSFSDIMNGAFDFQKSPKGLGNRLAEVGGPSTIDRKFHSPFDPLYSSPENPVADWPSPTRAGKRNASSQIGPLGKQAKSSHAPDSQSCVSNPNTATNMPPVGNQTGSVTVGFTLPSPTTREPSPELMHLLEMIRQNTDRSRELSDMVANYISRHSPDSLEAAPIAGETKTLLCKDIISSKDLLSPPRRPSAIACGGDSPDPPRDNLNHPRGHMIDKNDVGSKSPYKSRDPSCDGERGMQLKIGRICYLVG